MKENSATIKKRIYISKLKDLVQQYPKILIVGADHVGSKQLADIRASLRGRAEILMGKNTLMRCALGQQLETMPQIQNLIDLVKLNVGFIFCGAEPLEIRDVITANKSPELARQGVIAPLDVFVPPGGTGLDPSQTSFFQALGIATKIVRGQIEIQNQVHLIKQGEKVSASAASLLQKLNIKPFTYGLGVNTVYDDGEVYEASYLDLKSEDVLKMFAQGIQNVAAASLSLDFPTEASVSHSITYAFKNCVAAVINSDYTFPEMQSIRDYLKNPSAFAAAASAAPAAEKKQAAATASEPEPLVASETESEDMFLPGF